MSKRFTCVDLFSGAGGLSRGFYDAGYDVVLGVVGASCWLYIVINFDSLVRRSGNNTVLDVIIGIIGILILFESVRSLR